MKTKLCIGALIIVSSTLGSAGFGIWITTPVLTVWHAALGGALCGLSMCGYWVISQLVMAKEVSSGAKTVRSR